MNTPHDARGCHLNEIHSLESVKRKREREIKTEREIERNVIDYSVSADEL